MVESLVSKAVKIKIVDRTIGMVVVAITINCNKMRIVYLWTSVKYPSLFYVIENNWLIN